MHKEFGGFDVELFGDIFTDFDQIAAALFALAGLRLMAVFDARQVIRQRLAPSACTLRLLRSRQRQLLDFRFDRRHIGLPVFFEQTQLWLRQRFALHAVAANAAQMGQFQRQRLILPFQQFELVLCLRKQ